MFPPNCWARDTPLDCDVIVCSDDPDAAQLTRELAAKIPGVRAIDGGKLENARIVEQITALLIGMNIRHKGPRRNPHHRPAAERLPLSRTSRICIRQDLHCHDLHSHH